MAILRKPVAQTNVVSVELKEGESVRVDPGNIKCRKPPYLAICGGKYLKGNKKNLLQQIGDMDPAERWFFLLVEKHMDDETNTAIIINASLTQSDKNKKTKGFKGLSQKKIIKKVKREHYMINPDIIIPMYTNKYGAEIYPILKEKWAALP